MNIQSLLTPDLVNGLFEFGGALSIGYNTFRVWKDKMVKGVSLLSTTFFTGWGLWNLYYYPSLHQPMSFAGGVAIVITNATWLSLMWTYRKTSSETTITAAPAPMTFDDVCEVLDKTSAK